MGAEATTIDLQRASIAESFRQSMRTQIEKRNADREYSSYRRRVSPLIGSSPPQVDWPRSGRLAWNIDLGDKGNVSVPDTYGAQEHWRRYLPFLPPVMRLPREPEEQWWAWRGTNVHLDRLDAEDAALKIIVLHGGGGTGRLVSAFGALVHSLGVEVPDIRV